MIHKHPFPRTLLALAAALLVLAALPLMAQGPGHGPGPGHGQGHGAGPGAAAGPGGFQFDRLASWLELTDEQKEAARAIFEAARAEAQPLREEQKALREELRTLLDGDEADATEVGNLVLALHDNREALRAIFDDAKAEFKALLTPEQLEKLEQAEKVRKHFGGGGGPGNAAGSSFGPGFGSGFGPGPGSCPACV